MSNKQNHIDLRTLINNLRDLDYVSKRVSNELRNKNEILKGGVRDCAQCKLFIDNSVKNKQRK